MPTPCRGNLGFGGNTSCVQVETAEGASLIFDAGTGIRGLGRHLVEQADGRPLDIHLFFTHFHWDHVMGLPFFQPLYDERNSITIYSSSSTAPAHSSVAGVMAYPYFPVAFDSLPSHIRFVEMASQKISLGPAEVQPFPVFHPQGACAYKISVSNATVIYAPDREPGDEHLERVIREQSRGANLLIHDSNYTPDEYAIHHGWGHSSWRDAVQVACDSKVERLILFHHDPLRTDEMLARIAGEAKLLFPNTEAATEGASIEI